MQNEIFYKKLSKRISLFPSGVELGSPKYLPFLKYKNTLEWGSKFTLSYMLPKIPNVSKNASNKSCAEWNFLQKTFSTHVAICLLSGERGPAIFEILKTLSRFSLGLNAAKNTYYIEKCFKQKLRKIKFLTVICGRKSLSPSGVEQKVSENFHFWNIKVLWNREKKVTLGLKTSKNYRLFISKNAFLSRNS